MAFSFEPDPETQQRTELFTAQLQSQDRRVQLQCRIAAREKVLAAISLRLKQDPENNHQRFIFEEHQRAHAALLEELRLVNLELSSRYGQLEQFVGNYLSGWQEETVAEELDEESRARLQELEVEKNTWEDLIGKVRARLVKKPGDPLLMRLLAEHQARLLSVQEQSRRIKEGKPAEELLVLEQVEARYENSENSEVNRLRREIQTLKGLIDKTQQRLAAKPELKHLKGLIEQHEARITELQTELRKLMSQ